MRGARRVLILHQDHFRIGPCLFGRRERPLGRALTARALETARNAGYRRVRLDTLPGMSAARELYRQMGFREIAAYRHNPVPGTSFLEYEL